MPPDQRSHEAPDIGESADRFGYWELDLRDMALTLSDTARSIYGIERPACPLDDFLQRVHPDERRRVRDKVRAALRTGARLDVGYRIVHPSGEERQVHVRAELLGTDGGRARYLGTVQDVSGQRRAEQQAARMAERLSATLESITDAFYTLDRDWRFTYLNREAERLFKLRVRSCSAR